jgi:hypothetical protein
MELSPVDNYPRGTGPAFPERFRYEPVTLNYISLSMHFDPLLAVFFHWLGELASASFYIRCNTSAAGAERCRSAALGGHQLPCPACAQPQIAYSCRNRHCPKCQGGAAQRWLQARQADLLPVDYYHLVFTLPGPRVPLSPYCTATQLPEKTANSN